MYTDFYKLNRNPFEITPDPHFLYSTKQHKEGLAALYYGVRQRKGFVVLTGEAGTGKTLLIRCLLQLCKGTDIASAYVFNSRLSTLDFLQYVCTDLGMTVAGKRKGELLHDLNSFLLARYQKKLTTMIVVDEAHHLSTEVLEEIRLLTNLETAEEKLVQIVLVGQSELSDKLDSFDLRQLKQRVALRAYLQPLDLESTRGYIHSRLQLAGSNCEPNALFPNETVAKIHLYSRGIPRLINTMSDNALITAFARQLATVLPGIIDEVAAELRLGMGKLRSLPAYEPKRGPEQTLFVGQSLLQLRHQI
jgi:general secretion pathway protein A